jgi:hypothetical protein
MRCRCAELLTILFVVPLVGACEAKVLSFVPSGGGATQAPSKTDAGTTEDSGSTPTPTPPAPGTIAALTDAGAEALCEWLAQEYQIAAPGQVPSADPSVGVPSGYAGGPAIGCQGLEPNTPPFQQLSWVCLSQQDCVLNLRSSPCAATVDSLQQCITAFVAYHDPTADAGGPDNSCTTACVAFESAASCGQTVIQWTYAKPPTQYSCGVAVPIVPDAICPDGGT